MQSKNDKIKKIFSEIEQLDPKERSQFMNQLLQDNIKEMLDQGIDLNDAVERAREENEDIYKRISELTIKESENTSKLIQPFIPDSLVMVDPNLAVPVFMENKDSFNFNDKQDVVIQLNYNEKNLASILKDSSIDLTAFDKLVYDTICTLYVYGNKIISIDMIYRVIASNQPRHRVTAKEKKEIQDSIIKMLNRTVRIKEHEGRELYFTLITGAFSKAKHASNGRTIEDCLVLASAPILYSYSLKLGDASMVKLEALKSEKSSTRIMVSAQSYILTRMQMAVSKNKKFVDIDLDEIYIRSCPDIITIENSDEAKKRRHYIRKHILDKLLADWEENSIILSHEYLKTNPSSPRMVSTLRILCNANIFHPAIDVIDIPAINK